jgi:protein-tyrosine phosphatase
MAEPFSILVVCTGNICRSPMAQVLLTHRLKERYGDDAARYFTVASAGTHGLADHPIEDDASRVLISLGVEPGEFAARRLLPDLVVGADLVLGATREHRAAAVTLVPAAAARTFTLREFARLAAAADVPGPSDDVPDAARALVQAAVEQRGIARAAHFSEDDLVDPYRQPAAVFEIVGREIDSAVTAIVDQLARVTNR